MSSIRGTMPVLEGQALEDYIQQFIVGVSGLPGPMVRQRWQPEPPNIPDFGVDWAACGITRHRPIGPYAAIIHHGDGDGYDEMQRHETLEILVSFYGPNADDFAGNFHNGLMVWQNHSILRQVDMALVEVSEGVRVPEMIKMRWWDRVDKPLTLRREVRRSYPILNLVSAGGFVIADPGRPPQAPFQDPFTAAPPTIP